MQSPSAAQLVGEVALLRLGDTVPLILWTAEGL